MHTNCSVTISQTIPGAIVYPESLTGFINQTTDLIVSDSGQLFYHIYGEQFITPEDSVCPCCKTTMHVHGQITRVLKHESKGNSTCRIFVKVTRFKCPKCHKTHVQQIPYECPNHRMTTDLYKQITYHLERHDLSLKKIAQICGVDPHTVKAIDKDRLSKLYTTEDGSHRKLKKPMEYSRYLGIDEFKLHNHHQYATHIIDLDTGHILWIAFGKKKQIVYDFINHVGYNWMRHVKAVSCDMNAYFYSAFHEKCPWIQVVYDRFHLIKNFNDKVISMVRKDEQRRLIEEGNLCKARSLKQTRYILLSSPETLERKDALASQGTLLDSGHVLFRKEPKIRKGGLMKKYKQLLKENELFFAIDLIKEELKEAYATSDENTMANHLTHIVEICNATKNEHFQWFSNLILKHWNGLISHAILRLSNGKIEGINNRIKTVRRMSYGFRDDEYFFLKLIDMSRYRSA